jgi:pseudouridine kinase
LNISLNSHRIAVVGGNNLDISATSSAPLVYGDSNPGIVLTGLGGVGRNIAENLTRLGQRTSLMTAFGGDSFAKHAIEQAEQIGLDLSHSLCIPDATSPVYICVNDANGDMSVAVNDMALISRITPEIVKQNADWLNGMEAVVIDTNLPAQTIAALAEQCTAPLFADAVSTRKANRLLPCLPHLFGLKANRLEIELLTGVTIREESDLTIAARQLHGKGVRYVFISLGARGAFASCDQGYVISTPFDTTILNTTGCGDAFAAAIVPAVLQKMPIRDILDIGLAAAALCVQSELAVSDHMTREALYAIIQNVHHKEELK